MSVFRTAANSRSLLASSNMSGRPGNSALHQCINRSSNLSLAYCTPSRNGKFCSLQIVRNTRCVSLLSWHCNVCPFDCSSHSNHMTVIGRGQYCKFCRQLMKCKLKWQQLDEEGPSGRLSHWSARLRQLCTPPANNSVSRQSVSV